MPVNKLIKDRLILDLLWILENEVKKSRTDLCSLLHCAKYTQILQIICEMKISVKDFSQDYHIETIPGMD